MKCQACDSDDAMGYMLSGTVAANLCAECRNAYHEWIVKAPELTAYLATSMVMRFAQTNGMPSASDAEPVVNEFLSLEATMHQKTMDWLAGRFG